MIPTAIASFDVLQWVFAVARVIVWLYGYVRPE